MSLETLDTMDAFTNYFHQMLEILIRGLPGAAAVVLGTLVLLFLVKRGFALLTSRGKISAPDVAMTHKAIKWVVSVVAFLLLIGVFGFDVGGLWTMLSTVLAMVAIGFVAAWSLLSNISSTAMIILFRPFGVGDVLEFVGEEGVRGRVVDLNFLYTTLETTDGEVLQIPNNQFFQKVLKRKKGVEGVSLTEQLKKEAP